MRGIILTALLVATPALALNEGLQCVPYARALSGVEIRGDAHTWWGKAAGNYERGTEPKVGAIMSFRPYGKMRLGHIAAVRRIVDDRTVIISHANWSTINGIRGHVEQNVRAVDVSEAGDWSRVRIWYTPIAAMGGTAWPLNGFIYPAKRRNDGDAHQAVVALLGQRAPEFMPVSGDKWSKEVKLAKVDAKADKSKAKSDEKDQAKRAKLEKDDKAIKLLKAGKSKGKPVRLAMAETGKKGGAAKGGFTLSPKLLAELDKRAVKEAKARAVKLR